MAVTHAAGQLSGIAMVRQSALPDPRAEAHTDLVIEMVGGVEPAFRIAMAALGRGTACITTSPLLIAAHGRVLHAAAVGQHTFLGASAVGFGLPVDDLLLSGRVQRIQLTFGTGAQAILARMGYRAESFSHAEHELRSLGVDLSDAGGKLSQARALALLATWRGLWPKLNATVRVGMDAFAPADFKALRGFGLQPVYGADLSLHGSVYTGPLAVAPGNPLLTALDREVMVLQTTDGDIVLTNPADETARVVSGVMTDLRRWLQRKPNVATQPAAIHDDMFSHPNGERCYVRVLYGQRDMVLADIHDVLHERVDGDGTWQAVVRGVDIRNLRQRLPEATIFPLAGAWEAPVAGLRLVG